MITNTTQQNSVPLFQPTGTGTFPLIVWDTDPQASVPPHVPRPEDETASQSLTVEAPGAKGLAVPPDIQYREDALFDILYG